MSIKSQAAIAQDDDIRVLDGFEIDHVSGGFNFGRMISDIGSAVRTIVTRPATVISNVVWHPIAVGRHLFNVFRSWF